MTKYSVTLLFVAAIAALAGCSYDTDSAPATVAPDGLATTTDVQLLVSSQQMASSSIASVTLSAVVLDAKGQAITGKPVSFSKGADNSAYFSNISATTDSNGFATAKLNIGNNMANRTINVSATADGAVGTNTVTVTGTKIAISGNTSLALTAKTTLTIIVKDSSGEAVQGVPLTVASQNGNTIVLNPATGITDSTGQITAVLTATNAGTGTDVLTVTGAGTTQAQTLTINSASFALTAPVIVPPAATPEIVVDTPTPVRVRWTNGGVPVVGQVVNFFTSRGAFDAGPFLTNALGEATANLMAGSTGQTIITASGPGGTPAATLNVVFVTTTAASIAAQASPGTVAVNASGSTGNQSVISVVVRDVNNNLVKNAHIVFSQVADASGGSLASNTATTDITGTASVNYIAGAISSGQNGVEIKASVDMVNSVPIAPATQPNTSVYLTVASQALFVRLGTDNKIYPDSPVAGVHTKEFTALVTDSAGNNVPDGTEVRFALRPAPLTKLSFRKGYFYWVPGTPGQWEQFIKFDCPSEDLNLDGILQLGEDTNGNGWLDPSGVATVNTTATTKNGFAIAKIAYAKEYSWWAQVDLEARAGTVGNDPPAVATLLLWGAAADYTSETIEPPGLKSPFGVGAGSSAGCADTL